MMLSMSVSYLFPPDDGVRAIQLVPTPKPRRDTKSVGDYSELMVIAALIRHGYLISIPFGENHRYDVIADNGERLLRIQVKTGRLQGGIINFMCSSSHQHRRAGPTSSRPYFGQIEYLAVFCPGTGKVYLLPESELVATKGHLRIAPCLNRQVRNIRWAAEYELA
jgi:PD-(D/E)XK endonuclease